MAKGRETKIIVFVNEGLDAILGVKPSPDGKQVVQQEENPVYRIGPDDRAALEEAVRLRDASGSGRVVAVTIGSETRTRERELRFCLARGVDQAVQVITEETSFRDAFTTAAIMQKVTEKIGFDIIICGNQSWDFHRSQVGAVLAESLGIPQVSRVVKIEARDRSAVRVSRRLDKGDREIVECPLPALVSIDHLIEEPEYIPVNALILSEREPIETWNLPSLGIHQDDLRRESAKVELVDYEPPRPRAKRIAVPDSSMSVDKKIHLLLAGGMTQDPKKGGGDFIQGAPDKVTGEIIKFLEEKGFIPSSK